MAPLMAADAWQRVRTARGREGDWMLYLRCSSHFARPSSAALNLFRYITFRTGGAVMTALLFVFLFGPAPHRLAARPAGQGPADPRRRAASHLRQEAARRPWAG